MSLVRDILGNYTLTGNATEADILEAAEEILRGRMQREHGALSSPTATAEFLRMRLGHLGHEEFHAIWLDNRHRVVSVQKLATGTIDGASVHPREVVKAALLQHGVAATVFAHCHPSGVPEPSAADRAITRELREALQLVGVRVLDHFVVTAGEWVSFAARGLI